MSLADRLQFLRVVIESEHYHIWCSSPIWGTDHHVHVFVSRIPIENNPDTNFGFDAWYATSEIAHYRASQPEGPYIFVRTLLRPGAHPAGAWNSGAMHNPVITQVGDEYVLLYHSNACTVGHNDRASYRIGMLTTLDLNGDWKDHGLLLAGPTAEELASWPSPLGRNAPSVDNPALLAHPNGKFYLYYRARWMGLGDKGNNSYAVAVADELGGPYHHHIARVVDNPRYIEDPFVYMSGEEVCMLVTDNHPGKGLLLKSKDPLRFSFNEAEEGFHVLERYIEPKLLEHATNYRSPKLERPQLLMRDGRPTHLFAPAGCNIQRGPGTCCYLFEITP